MKMKLTQQKGAYATTYTLSIEGLSPSYLLDILHAVESKFNSLAGEVSYIRRYYRDFLHK